MPEWTVSYLGALLYPALFGSVIAFGAYFTSLGASAPAKPPTVRCCFRWSPYPFPPFMKGMSGTASAVIGLALILLGNPVMFAKPEQLLLRRRLA